MFEIEQHEVVKANVIGITFFRANTFGLLEKLLVGLQGLGRASLKGLSKKQLFMWYRCTATFAIGAICTINDLTFRLRSLDSRDFQKQAD